MTISDVAKRAGISRATTARALGGYGSVSHAAREKVLAAAAELHYRPNLVARSTRSGNSTTVGVVIADISSPFFSNSTRGIADEASRSDLEIMLVNTDESLEAERTAVQLLLNQRVAGLIVAPASRDETDHLREAQDSGTPVVLLDRRVRKCPADRVFADNHTGAQLAMADLVDGGHRRIGYVSSAAGPQGWPVGTPVMIDDLITSAGDRIAAYAEALTLIGEDPFQHLALTAFGDEAAYLATIGLLSKKPRPTAIFASDGVIALSVLRAVQDSGLTIPDDVAVVAGDEPDWACITAPQLSAIRQPVNELGRQATRLLVGRMAAPSLPFTDVVLPTTYFPRGSTARR